MKLDYKNIEELIFEGGLVSLMPHLKPFYDQWKLSKISGELRPMGQRAKIDFIKNMTPEDIEIVSSRLGINIEVNQQLDYHIVNNLQCSINDLDLTLNKFKPSGNVRIFRNEEQVYLSIWK